jgi:hypothetical protein
MSIQLFQILIITFLILVPLIALVDVLRNDFKNNINKVVWVLVVILLPVLGAILYFTIGYKQNYCSNNYTWNASKNFQICFSKMMLYGSKRSE